MVYSQELAEIRFGYGLSPRHAPPATASEMLVGLTAPDTMSERFPVDDFQSFVPRLAEDARNRAARKATEGTADYEEADRVYRAARAKMRSDGMAWGRQQMQRRIQTETAFRERLVDFWTDHFTAYGKGGMMIGTAPIYMDDAIRPHVAGRFEDMLVASATHPVMLHFLDQNRSVGPASVAKQRALARGRRAIGLNENLAREILELHTLGVDGPYTQDDVRQLAELLTGLTYDNRIGFRFNPRFTEPGAEEVLGKAYGAQEPGLASIRSALTDLARHPATYRHLARKLAVHFVSDAPDPALVEALTTAFERGQGDLMIVYEVLLDHPAAWNPELQNIKPPFSFIVSSLRALSAPEALLDEMSVRDFRRGIYGPMTRMGQAWLRPAGPDGWPEQDSNWVTPQGLSNRIKWAMRAPRRLGLSLPDPRVFVETSLGDFAPEEVRFAAASAERKIEAIGLVLSSPAFQRR